MLYTLTFLFLPFEYKTFFNLNLKLNKKFMLNATSLVIVTCWIDTSTARLLVVLNRGYENEN